MHVTPHGRSHREVEEHAPTLFRVLGMEAGLWTEFLDCRENGVNSCCFLLPCYLPSCDNNSNISHFAPPAPHSGTPHRRTFSTQGLEPRRLHAPLFILFHMSLRRLSDDRAP